MQKKTSKEDKLEEIKEKLKSGVLSLKNSQQYKDYLVFMGNLHSYSTRNMLLIYQQMPNATVVGPYSFWKKQKRYVKKGEHAIRIFAPIIKHPAISKKEPENSEVKGHLDQSKSIKISDPEEVTGYRAVSIFDISQTDGEPIPNILNYLEGNSKTAQCLIDAITKVSDYPVIYDNCKGTGSFNKKNLIVRPDLSVDQTAKTLLHEYTHSCYHKDITDYKERRGFYENQAESTAFMVAHHFGLDTSEYSFAYISVWIEKIGDEAFINSLSDICNMASQVIENIEVEYSKAQIRCMVKDAGFVATDSVVNQMYKLNKITGKINTMWDIKNLSRTANQDVKPLAQSLKNQFKNQEINLYPEP